MLKHILSHISTGQMPVTQSQCIYQLSQCNVRASTFVLSSTTLVKQVWHGLSQTYGRPLLCQTGVACISPPNLSPIGWKKHVSHLFWLKSGGTLVFTSMHVIQVWNIVVWQWFALQTYVTLVSIVMCHRRSVIRRRISLSVSLPFCFLHFLNDVLVSTRLEHH